MKRVERGRCLVGRQAESRLERRSGLPLQRDRSGVGVAQSDGRLEDTKKQLVEVERPEQRRELARPNGVLLGPLHSAAHLAVGLWIARRRPALFVSRTLSRSGTKSHQRRDRGDREARGDDGGRQHEHEDRGVH
jgi:hypothetical protein